jgi:hypothetical protein
MDQTPYRRYPKNVPGPFYVQDGGCTACEAACHEARSLVVLDPEGYSCYFRRQPETPQEVEQAIGASLACCVDVVRYSGVDPVILARFRELGHIETCDVLAGEWELSKPRSAPPVATSLKAKLEMARRAADGKTKIRPGPGPHPLYDRDLDG